MQLYRVPLELKMMVSEGIERLTFGSALFSANYRERQIPRMPDFDHAEFPGLGAAVEANPYEEEEEFVEILRRFLSTF
jgi:hypothetical protein